MTARKDAFVPSNRHEWTSMVRPPEGYRLEAAIGTTFSLEFSALTAVLLAALDQQPGRVNWDERAHVLHAITQLSDNVRVLVNRGRIEPGIRASNKLFSLFDEMIDEVHLEHGSFHPKVWVLKFVARQALGAKSTDNPIYRLICSSRNLSLAATWEAMVCVEGTRGTRGKGDAIGQNVGAFFSTATRGRTLPAAVRQLVKDLPAVAFSMATGDVVREGEFHWQAPATRALEPRIPGSGATALLVSPFLREEFLKKVRRKFDRLIVVSRQQELDAIAENALAEVADKADLWVVKTPDVGVVKGDPVESLDLHAKILICEYSGAKGAQPKTEMWIGSANASQSAWGLLGPDRMNWEAMFRARPAIRPEQFLDQFAYKDDRKFNGWIELYVRRPVREQTPEEAGAEALDHAAKQIAGLDLGARLALRKEVATLILTAREPKHWAAVLAQLSDIAAEVCPMASTGEHPFQDVRRLLVGSIRFEGIAIAEIGTFVSIKLTHVPSKVTKTIAIKVTITGLPSGFWQRRRNRFLEANLSAKDFRVFLKCLLSGGKLPETGSAGGGDEAPPPPKRTTKKRRQQAPLRFFDELTIEEILEACTRDRALVADVDRLMQTFKEAGRCDEVFERFWGDFRNAVRS